MLNLFLLSFICIFLIIWIVVSIKSFDFSNHVYASSITRLQLQLWKSNFIAKQIAVGLVAITFVGIWLLAIFVDRSYSDQIFRGPQLPYSDLFVLLLISFGVLTLFSHSITQKTLSQLETQKANLSAILVDKVKRSNQIFNFSIVGFGVTLVLQIAYKTINM
ncbi:hypothetical protein ACQWTT_001280 [Acinetobacter baumannii]